MKAKEYSLVRLFGRFIKDSTTGKRLKPDGKRLKKGSIENYGCILLLLKKFEAASGTKVLIRPKESYTRKQAIAEKQYWKLFYFNFTTYMYTNGCYDNYVGSAIKCIRAFFNYLEQDLLMPVGKFHEDFYITRQEVPIVTLEPKHLQFLIYNKAFENSLPRFLRKIKDIFVTGCTVALRYCDLIKIAWHNIELRNGRYYLCVTAQKTGTITRVRLPGYVMAILNKYRVVGPFGKKIFPALSLHRFNYNIRRIMELAGHTQPIGKWRNKQGIEFAQQHPRTKRAYRFCDLVSSHTMRRTAITTMLMQGVPENIVKQISGHTNDSSSFYRYVNLAQSYIDTHLDIYFDKMMEGRPEEV